MFKNLLSMSQLSIAEIELILSEASKMKKLLLENKKCLTLLKGKSVITLFYENSTRTRVSFESAAKFLGADVMNISVSSSSVQKGETLIDTAKTLDHLNSDLVIIRHSSAGAAQLYANNISAKVINGGDGMHAHPTQALLDMFTLVQHFKQLKGLKVAIIGDIKHSRVALSNIVGLTKMGVEVRVFAPSTLMPQLIENFDIKVCKNIEEALSGANAVMGLRIQLERQQNGLFPSLSEYHKFYGITTKRLEMCDKNVIVMHPGPVNRNVEISSEVIDASVSVIDEQVNNGLSVRMALLKLMLGGENATN